jgi:hypothetical protein
LPQRSDLASFRKAGLIAKTVTVDQVADASIGEEVLKEMGK